MKSNLQLIKKILKYSFLAAILIHVHRYAKSSGFIHKIYYSSKVLSNTMSPNVIPKMGTQGAHKFLHIYNYMQQTFEGQYTTYRN